MRDEKPSTIEQRNNIRRKLLKKLVATASGIISYEVGMPVGVWKLRRIIGWLKLEGIVLNFPVLGKYDTATVAIPSGKERLNCSRNALRRYDAELNQINLRFHDHVIDVCFAIIDKYSDADKFIDN